jgi:type II secretion system (T2SS) protein N
MPTSPSPRRGAKPAPAPPARRLWPYLLAIFGVAVLAVAISALPASIVTHFLPVSVHAEDFSGSVWHGSAGRIAVAAHDAGALEWRLHPGALLHMRVAAELHWVKGAFLIDGHVEVDRSTLLGSHLEGGGPIEDLRDLGLAPGWRGIAKIQVEQLKAGLSSDAPSLQAAVGTIGVSNLASAQVAGGVDLGGYLLRFADPAITPDVEASAELTDTGGPLGVDATIHFDAKERRGMLSGTIKERDDAPAALRAQLDNLAQLRPRDAQGRLPVDLEFSL